MLNHTPDIYDSEWRWKFDLVPLLREELMFSTKSFLLQMARLVEILREE